MDSQQNYKWTIMVSHSLINKKEKQCIALVNCFRMCGYWKIIKFRMASHHPVIDYFPEKLLLCLVCLFQCNPTQHSVWRSDKTSDSFCTYSSDNLHLHPSLFSLLSLSLFSSQSSSCHPICGYIVFHHSPDMQPQRNCLHDVMDTSVLTTSLFLYCISLKSLLSSHLL